jgi:hypothetical protein
LSDWWFRIRRSKGHHVDVVVEEPKDLSFWQKIRGRGRARLVCWLLETESNKTARPKAFPKGLSKH